MFALSFVGLLPCFEKGTGRTDGRTWCNAAPPPNGRPHNNWIMSTRTRCKKITSRCSRQLHGMFQRPPIKRTLVACRLLAVATCFFREGRLVINIICIDHRNSKSCKCVPTRLYRLQFLCWMQDVFLELIYFFLGH